jgi:hypothetical protein
MAWRIAANMFAIGYRAGVVLPSEKNTTKDRVMRNFSMTAAEFSFYLTRRSLAWLWAIGCLMGGALPAVFRDLPRFDGGLPVGGWICCCGETGARFGIIAE